MPVRVALLPLILLAAPVQAAPGEPPEPTYSYPTPEAARAAINRDEATKARRQLEENAANLRAFEAAQAAREEQIRSDQAAWEAEKARLAEEHEAAMEQWRADVAACRSGDRTRCKR